MREIFAILMLFCSMVQALSLPRQAKEKSLPGNDSQPSVADGAATTKDVPANASTTNTVDLTSTNETSSATATNLTYKIPENRILEFNVPLSTAAKLAVANSKNPPVGFARAGIAVPTGFEPDLPTCIVLVGATSDGDGSSIRAMRAYTNVALRLGCLVVAADGPFGKPANDSPPWRWAMISSVFDHIHSVWPKSKTWPVICAGTSGGGKWAGVLGAILAQKNFNLIGVFMAAVNQDYASEAAKLYEPALRYKKVPIYISSGSDDKIATPQQHLDVKESLLANGFTRVRLETFKGGHALSDFELRKAINWFVELYGKGE